MPHNEISRRSILRMAAASAATGILGTAGATAYMTQKTAQQPIGLQLYTLRSFMEKDVAATLAQVGAIGYHEVEFAGYFNHPISKIKQWLADSNLTAPSAHVRIADFENRFDEVLETAAELGHKNLIVPWLAPEERTDRRYHEIADLLNRAGEIASPAGIQVGYHNHEFEFEKLGNTTGYDILLNNADPNLVKFELDVYWVAVAGVDTIALLGSQPGRFPCIHVKDLGSDGSIVDVGDGVIDFTAIYAAREKAGIKHFFVEHDNSSDPIRTIQRSFTAFSAAIG